MTTKFFRTLSATLVMTAVLSGVSPTRLRGQTPARVDVQPNQVVQITDQNAERTREQLREILDRYPPSLRQVLRLDPSLLTQPVYLALYPGLSAFLAQHPEVAHNPTYFIGGPGPGSYENNSTANAMENIMVGMEVASFFITALFIVSWIARSVLEHKRWQQAMKSQTEAHTKLVDRLANNDDLLNYVQSAAGQRFLTAAPLLPTIDNSPRSVGAPIGRILWSMQTGIVVGLAGMGLWVAKNNVMTEVAQPLVVLGILGMAVGLGFVLSAFVSYALSRQLGLIQSSSPNA